MAVEWKGEKQRDTEKRRLGRWPLRRHTLNHVRAKLKVIATRGERANRGTTGENNRKHTGENCFSLSLIRRIEGLYSS